MLIQFNFLDDTAQFIFNLFRSKFQSPRYPKSVVRLPSHLTMILISLRGTLNKYEVSCSKQTFDIH